MRLSDGVEWGIHCAVILGALTEGVVLASRDLATIHGVSESYLLKHLKLMAKAGILESVPGPNGGFRLAKPATQISLLEVLESIEGPFAPFRCTEIRQRGPVAGGKREYRAPCQIHASMREAERAYKQVLREKSVADILAQMAEQIPPERLKKAEEWLMPRIRLPIAKGEMK